MSVHNRMRRVGAPGAGIVWAALAGLSDQPLGIVAGGEAAEASRTSSTACEMRHCTISSFSLRKNRSITPAVGLASRPAALRTSMSST